MKKFNELKSIIVICIVVQVIIALILSYIFTLNLLYAIFFILVNAIIIYYVSFIYQENTKKSNYNISQIVGEEANEAFLYGNIAMLTYDNNYTITWMSSLFYERNLDRVGKKLLLWLPETSELIAGDVDSVKVKINEMYFEVVRRENAQILFFRDITNEQILTQELADNQIVVGLVHLDNYNETTQFLDEQEASNINNRIRQPIVDWFKSNGIMFRRLRADRYFLVLNEQIFENIVENHFSIVRDTRRTSAEIEVDITLSMAFAKGSNDFSLLDETLNELLELAQTRGGDQVAIKKIGEDIKFFGGSSEALEKRSRVRVRIMANTLRDLIVKSSNVIICGHKEMDFDCMGAAIGVSKIVQSYNRQVSIIAKTGGIEAKLNMAMNENMKHLSENHRLVTESEALNQLKDDTLVIMVDHHSLSQSNGGTILEQAKKIVILDHHRRSADLQVNPMLIYIEPSASSSCELISELLPYLKSGIEIDSIEATIMLAGMTIDTNRFSVRTTSRTFDAASYIRTLGADPGKVDEYLKDIYQDFETKNEIMKYATLVHGDILIVPVDSAIIPTRALISQAANQMLAVKEIEAVFVISKISDKQVAISARSKGKVNVQFIMEQLHGGGHFTMAATQRDNISVNELTNELLQVLEEYLKESSEDESNSIK